MFAYTGLKPEQMDKLAKEVRWTWSVLDQRAWLTRAALGVRDQGWADIGCWNHERQRQAAGRGHPPGDGIGEHVNRGLASTYEHSYSRRVRQGRAWSWMRKPACRTPGAATAEDKFTTAVITVIHPVQH